MVLFNFLGKKIPFSYLFFSFPFLFSSFCFSTWAAVHFLPPLAHSFSLSPFPSSLGPKPADPIQPTTSHSVLSFPFLSLTGGPHLSPPSSSQVQLRPEQPSTSGPRPARRGWLGIVCAPPLYPATPEAFPSHFSRTRTCPAAFTSRARFAAVDPSLGSSATRAVAATCLLVSWLCFPTFFLPESALRSHCATLLEPSHHEPSPGCHHRATRPLWTAVPNSPGRPHAKTLLRALFSALEPHRVCSSNDRDLMAPHARHWSNPRRRRADYTIL